MNEATDRAHRLFYDTAIEVIAGLERSKENLEQLLDFEPDYFIIFDTEGTICRANRIFAKSLMGSLDFEDANGQNLYHFLDAASVTPCRNALAKLVSRQKSHVVLDLSLRRSTKCASESHPGSKVTVIETVASLRPFGEIFGVECFILTAKDVTQLRETKRQFDSMLSCIPVGFLTIAENGVILGPVSRYIEETLGIERLVGTLADDTIARRLKGFSLRFADLIGLAQDEFLTARGSIDHDYELESESGQRYLRISMHPILKERVEKIVLILQDNTDSVLWHNAARKAEELAKLDGLTGLFNRRCLDRDLGFTASDQKSRLNTYGLVMCDIDHFKAYNDRYGHPAGDRCIQLVAEAIQASCRRNSDRAYRYGGEEFFCLLENSSEEGLTVFCHRLIEKIRLLALPHEASQTAPCVTLSVGAYLWNPAAGETDVQAAIAMADRELYFSKHHGRNQFSVHRQSGGLRKHG